MTSFAHVDFPTVHPGVERAERTLELLAPVVRALAAIGAPVVAAYCAWAAARRQARLDAQYWNAAMSDARLMADISRTMSAEARKVSSYWDV